MDSVASTRVRPTKRPVFSVSISIQLEKRTETANLRQRHVVRQAALPYLAYWQRVLYLHVNRASREHYLKFPDHPQN